MSRRIALSVPGRTALIPLELRASGDSQTEFEALRGQFLKLCSGDPYLEQKMETHFPTFEYYDSEFETKMQLVSSMEVLPQDQKVFTVKFVAKNSPMKSPPAGPSTSVAASEVLETSATLLSQDILVEYIPLAASMSDNLQLPVENGEAAGDFDLTSGGSVTEVPQEEHHTLDISPLLQSISGSGTNVDVLLKYDDMSMPKFSKEVIEIMKCGKLLSHSRKFIKQCSKHLLTLKPSPRTKDIETFVLFFMNMFPDIDKDIKIDPNMKFGKSMFEMIYNHIRNKKQREGKRYLSDKPEKCSFVTHNDQKNKSSAKSMDDSDQPPPAKKTKQGRGKNVDEGAQDAANPIKMMTRKKFDPASLIEKLGTFTNERRAAVDKFETIKKLLKAWPAFGNAQVVTAEFYLCCGLNEQRIKENFDNFLKRLELMYTETCKNEADKLSLLRKVEDELAVHITQNYPKAFSIEKLGDGEQPKLPSKILANGPVSVSYLTSNGEIAATYLLAEATTICSLKKATAFSVYALLAGAYYAYSRSYPVVSRNLFDLMDLTVLEKTNSNSSQKLAAFKRKYFI